MCGIAGIVTAGGPASEVGVRAMTRVLFHRGPDDEGIWVQGSVGLGNQRLAILDLGPAGHQPMASPGGRFVLTYNGEVYNYVELRRELGGTFRSEGDTEVILRALERWGHSALDRFNGMFAFALWDQTERTLLLARDRFGVKPLYYAEWEGALYFASEIKALAAAGVPIEPDPQAWATYLIYGLHDHGPRTFFKNIHRLLPGHALRWGPNGIQIWSWYDVAARVGAEPVDARPDDEVAAEYRNLMVDAVRLRFRSDVSVGVTLSGGLDSSTLVGALFELFGPQAQIQAYHFATGDPNYDETPWVRKLLERSNYPLHVAALHPEDVPALAEEAAYYQEEPFGGFPTLAMTRLFALAKDIGTVVLLGGEGMDEQWAGYDYYTRALNEDAAPDGFGPVQASRSQPTRPECLTEEFRNLAVPLQTDHPFPDNLRNWQYQDLRMTKMPRALRFGDHASSQSSRELREPFLDYRLVELAFRQPAARTIRDGEQKFLLRRIARELMPDAVAQAPKRPVQTPQREWLRAPLRRWVEDCLQALQEADRGWFDPQAIRRAWEEYLQNDVDNSFFVFQWVSAALNESVVRRLRHVAQMAGRVRA